MNDIYDLIIIGGGPAGLSAGIYASRAMLDTLIIEKKKIGGQAETTSEIVNYPGFRNTTGPKLTEEMRQHAVDFDVEFSEDDILEVDFDSDIKTIKGNNKTYQAHSIIIATGAQARRIGFKGEDDFVGRGIAYCATCDGEFFKDMDIFVIGGGFAAAEEAVFLTRYGKSVTIIIREPDFTCAQMVADGVKANEKIKVVYNTEVKEVSGDGMLQKAVFINNETGETFEHEANVEDGMFGMFVFAGTKPSTDIFKDKIELDSHGYIPVDANMQTNIPGVYAAGDLLPKELRQIVTAVADGAIAGTHAQKYVTQQKAKLGLPEVSTRKKSVKKEDAPTNSDAPTFKGNWFPAEMQQQIGGILEKLNKISKLVQFNDNSEKSNELKGFLQEFAKISDKVEYEEVSSTSNDDRLNDASIDKYPSFALYVDNKYTGIKFSGIPSGHELNSLILALYNTAGPGQELDESIVERIKNLPATKIQVAVSLSCTLCPDVVAATQRIAAINPNISTEMLDLSLFPDLKKEHKIMSVPAMIVNDQDIVFGSKSMDEIINLLNK
ncbi:MAG: FAD-dependent oxidoreductase [Erysipelotrichales bacterium]